MRTTITTWTLALLALVTAAVLLATACTTAPPGRIDARPECDLVSCEAGAAFECCSLVEPKRVKVVSPLGAAIKTGWVADFNGFAGTSRGCLLSTGSGRFALPMPLDEGDRMLRMVVAAIGNGTDGMSIASFSAAPDGSLTLGTVGSLDVVVVPQGWTDYSIDLVDTVVSGGVSHWFEFSTSGAGLCVGAIRLTYSRPSP